MIWAKLRSKLNRVSTFSVLLGLLAFMALGIAVTLFASDDPKWAQWHFSYLGEGGSVSARIFNLTLMASSGFLFVAAYTIRQELYVIKNSDEKFRNIWPNFFCANLIFMGLSLILVALTPRDLYPSIHDIFGHDVYYSVVVMSLVSPLFLPGYSPWFYVYSYAQHAVYLLFEYLYRIEVLTNLYPMQITIFLVSCLWIVAASWPAHKLERHEQSLRQTGTV